MDKNSQVGELIEKGQTTASNAVKTTVSDIAGSVSDQLGIGNEKGTNQQIQTQVQPQLQQQTGEPRQVLPETTDRTKEIVEDFYGPSENPVQNNPVMQEEAQTQQKLLKVRQELQQQHNEVYYNPLINPQKPEERPAEVAAQEEQQKKLEDLQTAQKKNEDLDTFRKQRTAEIKVGIGG